MTQNIVDLHLSIREHKVDSVLFSKFLFKYGWLIDWALRIIQERANRILANIS
jgi:hypothetical protein